MLKIKIIISTWVTTIILFNIGTIANAQTQPFQIGQTVIYQPDTAKYVLDNPPTNNDQVSQSITEIKPIYPQHKVFVLGRYQNQNHQWYYHIRYNDSNHGWVNAQYLTPATKLNSKTFTILRSVHYQNQSNH